MYFLFISMNTQFLTRFIASAKNKYFIIVTLS